MPRVLRKLALLFLLCAFLNLTTVQPAAAQEGEGEFWGRPWWMNTLSMAASVMAGACIAIAVAELGVKHRAFWGIHVLAAVLIVMGLVLVEYGSPFFWLALIIGIMMVAVVSILLIAEAIARKLTGR